MLCAFLVRITQSRVTVGWRRGLPLRPNTLIAYTTAVRGFFRWLVRRDHLLLDPTVHWPRSGRDHPLPRVLSVTDVLRLLAAPSGGDPVALRDRAILETLYGSGLRAGELLNLTLGAIDLVRGEITLTQTKGGSGRRVPLGDPAGRALQAYLDEGRERLVWTHVAELPPEIFLTRAGTRLRHDLLGKLVRERCAQAGILGRITPHTLRHTAAVHLLCGGADIRSVQEFLGHASLDTTMWYTRLQIDDLKAELKRSHPRARLRI